MPPLGRTLASVIATCALLLIAACTATAPPDSLRVASGGDATDPPSDPQREASWATERVPEDRRSVTIVYAGGDCEQVSRSYVTETGSDGGSTLTVHVLLAAPQSHGAGEISGCTNGLRTDEVTVSLPRPLREDENILGYCTTNGDGYLARVCQAVHDSIKLRQRTASDDPSPPRES